MMLDVGVLVELADEGDGLIACAECPVERPFDSRLAARHTHAERARRLGELKFEVWFARQDGAGKEGPGERMGRRGREGA